MWRLAVLAWGLLPRAAGFQGASVFGVSKARPFRAGLAAATAAAAADVVVAVAEENVSVGRGRIVIDSLTMTIREGERWAVLGPNGSGKSALADVLKAHVGGEVFQASVVQRRTLSRNYDLAKGFEELEKAAPTVAVKPAPSGLDTETKCHDISFEAHRKLLADEALEFAESRYSVVHKRATVSSFLFPDDSPAEKEAVIGYRPTRTRLAPLPVPYDADATFPKLATLEKRCLEHSALLDRFGLFSLRHAALYAFSTGELRKLMVLDVILRHSESSAEKNRKTLVVLDEASDGLDVDSMAAVRDLLPSIDLTAVVIAHRQADLILEPTHAILLDADGGYRIGNWAELEQDALRLLDATALRPGEAPEADSRAASTAEATATARAVVQDAAPLNDADAVVLFRDVKVSYAGRAVLSGLNWRINKGENWAVVGGNGCGKSTVLELISGENPLAFGQDITLFGRQKGSGESVWDIKRQLGQLSTRLHMDYAAYADEGPGRGPGQNGALAKITPWEVILSGFFDSIGLYEAANPQMLQQAFACVNQLRIQGIVFPGAAETAGAPLSAMLSARKRSTEPAFSQLSLGEQKLVLLCRAVVKTPKLLLLDEPTHGLSAESRDTFLAALRVLADSKEMSVVYVTHKQDELDRLDFANVLHLS
ncbi:P-loop containing nucleoside triphosphate hydrolase protein [Pelagophyceae sp. CCMP2097]|nr:P-loop containing nucleoside triphosphate hydrolase protein [Pelagophyceae sp. CCMP2097]|mmetsp:Transcript_9407/g.31110  ORF Transcript_9407/g.31110 Transcript_9407/m.31110 type:complete len:654 (-) Transcript_9407:26-1987(-)